MIVRYGELIMCEDDTEDGRKSVNVISYIAHEMAIDSLQFHHPIYQQILEEAIRHQSEDGFKAEHFFTHHNNPEINQISVNLISDRYQLSKYHFKNQTVVNDEDRLAELVPILMTNFKYVVVSNKLKTLMQELQEASKIRDEQRCNTIIKEYSELLEVQKIMAKTLGDRVVLNL